MKRRKKSRAMKAAYGILKVRRRRGTSKMATPTTTTGGLGGAP
jgi:hypothetical protein